MWKVLLAFALLGCQAPQRFDYTFAATEDVEEARAAAAEWTACSVVTARVRQGAAEPGEIPIRRVTTIADSPASTGEASKNGAISYVRYAGTQATLAHEMGHVFGLHHAPTGLMRATNTADPAEGHVRTAECAALLARD